MSSIKQSPDLFKIVAKQTSSAGGRINFKKVIYILCYSWCKNETASCKPEITSDRRRSRELPPVVVPLRLQGPLTKFITITTAILNLSCC